MAEDGKKSGLFAQITVAIVIALCVGGSSPWWFKELFSAAKPDTPSVGTQPVAATRPVVHEELAKLDKSDLASRQAQLETELAELRKEQTDNPQPRSVRSNANNIGGAWEGGGSTYTFYQNGTSLTMEEFTAGFGKTAIAEGSISGHDVVLTVQTTLGTQGTLRATLSADGHQLDGTYTDHTFGAQTPYTLTR